MISIVMNVTLTFSVSVLCRPNLTHAGPGKYIFHAAESNRKQNDFQLINSGDMVYIS
jgi:hypothetical protein